MDDVGTILWKEWREIVSWTGTRGRFGAIILVFVVGIFLPWRVGSAWVTSSVMLVYWAWVPMFLVVSVIADSFAGERERHTLETLLATRLSDRVILVGKIIAGMGYGLGLSWLSVLIGLATANLTAGHGHLLIYTPSRALAIVGVSLFAAGLAATAGMLVSLRAATVRQAQQTLSISMIVLVFGLTFAGRALPAAWRSGLGTALTDHPVLLVGTAVLVLLVLDVGLFFVGVARFRRARLILD